MRFDCAQMEITFLRKRLAQFEERLESELNCRKELEQKVSAERSALFLFCSVREWGAARVGRAERLTS